MVLSISLAIITVINIVLGFRVWWQHRQEPVNRIFLGLCLSIALWSGASMVNAAFSNNIELGNITEKTAFIAALIIAFFFFQFCKYFLYKTENSYTKWSAVYICSVIIWIYITYFTDIFILYSERINWYITTYHNPYTYILWVISLLIPFMFGLNLLNRKLQDGDGILRQKIASIWILLIVSIVGSFTFDVLLTGFYLYQFNNIGPLFSLVFDLAIVMLIYSKD